VTPRALEAAAAVTAAVAALAVAAPVALAGVGEPSLDAADRYLQQQFRAQLQPQWDQLLRFRQVLLQLRRLPAGHPKPDRFWADYEVSWLCLIRLHKPR
jgi:hypothetical protein